MDSIRAKNIELVIAIFGVVFGFVVLVIAFISLRTAETQLRQGVQVAAAQVFMTQWQAVIDLCADDRSTSPDLAEPQLAPVGFDREAALGTMFRAIGDMVTGDPAPAVAAVYDEWSNDTECEAAKRIRPPVIADPSRFLARVGLENELLRRTDPLKCDPYADATGDDNNPFLWGSRAAVNCEKPVDGLRHLTLFAFLSPMEVGRYWDERMSRIDWDGDAGNCGLIDGVASTGIAYWELTATGGARLTASPSARTAGQVACFYGATDNRAKIRWIDERAMTYGVVDGRRGGMARILGWWMEAAADL